jgi:hypothetical protein
MSCATRESLFFPTNSHFGTTQKIVPIPGVFFSSQKPAPNTTLIAPFYHPNTSKKPRLRNMISQNPLFKPSFRAISRQKKSAATSTFHSA